MIIQTIIEDGLVVLYKLLATDPNNSDLLDHIDGFIHALTILENYS